MIAPDTEMRLPDRAKKLARLGLLGQVTGITGPVIRVQGLSAVVGQHVNLWVNDELPPALGEVIGLENDCVLLMALGPTEGIGLGADVSVRGRDPRVPVGEAFLGRIVDGLGQPLDGLPPPIIAERRPLQGDTPGPLKRARIRTPFSTGVRAVDALLTLGRGQRTGIFAGAGIGKSTLLSMIARHAAVDVCIVALIGERGREVREFVEDAITQENRERTIVVAVTGDQAPLVRIRGAMFATSLAEYFRSQGQNVLMLLDSLTRFAMAQREVGLAAGELPASKGYPPSVFVELARILERAGNDSVGSITGVYTVLVEGDDMTDPVADATLALMDGHIVLSRTMANRGIFPAVDVLRSTSRLMDQVSSREHLTASRNVKAMLSTYEQVEDLIRIGAYQPGSDPAVDEARAFVPKFEQFVTQEVATHARYEASLNALIDLGKNRKK